MADLGGVQPDPEDPVQIGLGRPQGCKGRVLLQMAEETEDQAGTDSQAPLRLGHAAEQPVGDGGEGNAPVCMGLRIEEQLHMPAAIRRDPPEIGHRQVVEIGLGLQHACALVINVQKVLQVGKGVGRPHRLDIGERQAEAVAPRQIEHQFGLQAALDVQMQLGFGQAPDEGGKVVHDPRPITPSAQDVDDLLHRRARRAVAQFVVEDR